MKNPVKYIIEELVRHISETTRDTFECIRDGLKEAKSK